MKKILSIFAIAALFSPQTFGKTGKAFVQENIERQQGSTSNIHCLLTTPLGSQSIEFSDLKNGRPQKKILAGGNGGTDGLGFVELTLLEHQEYPSIKAVFEGQLDGPGFSIGGTAYLFAYYPNDPNVNADTIKASYQRSVVSLKCTQDN